MKTTNCEISRKLWEIGFDKPEEATGSYCDVEQKETEIGFVPTIEHCYLHYSLETILEALPKGMDNSYYSLVLNFDGEYESNSGFYMCYSDLNGKVANKDEVNLEVSWNGRESLADCAARLLLLLHEKGIWNFKS